VLLVLLNDFLLAFEGLRHLLSSIRT
jgi:hypothetical protein